MPEKLEKKLESQVCRTCGAEKQLSDFTKDKKRKNGIVTQCRDCRQRKALEWKKAHPENIKASMKRQQARRPEVFAAWGKAWREANPNRHKDEESRRRTAENGRARKLKFKQESPDKYREQQRKKQARYKTLHPERVRKRENDRRKRKLARDPTYRLNGRMSNSIRKAIRENKGGRHWEGLVGYSRQQLVAHLEKRFLPGMAWDNMGEWHIDHKIPRAAFNFQTAEDADFKKCWALKNLQPLWRTDNLVKHAKLAKPHQPSLLI